jgi:hypothetical protein
MPEKILARLMHIVKYQLKYTIFRKNIIAIIVQENDNIYKAINGLVALNKTCFKNVHYKI